MSSYPTAKIRYGVIIEEPPDFEEEYFMDWVWARGFEHIGYDPEVSRYKEDFEKEVRSEFENEDGFINDPVSWLDKLESEREDWGDTPKGQTYYKALKKFREVVPEEIRREDAEWEEFYDAFALVWGRAGMMVDLEGSPAGKKIGKLDVPGGLQEYFDNLWEILDWSPEDPEAGWILIPDYY